MVDTGIQRLVSIILLVIFLVSLLAGSAGFYLLLRHQAVRDAEQQARVLLAAAMGVRGYTGSHIEPQFNHLPHDQFHEETVPSFAAQTVLKSVSAGELAYSYREPALNPTAGADRATPFEVELIRRFADDGKLQEVTGTMTADDQKLFYLAHPIRINDPACLSCHDTPARAPAAMLAKYGAGNGFGWQVGQTVAMQILTVPVVRQFANTLQLVGFLAVGLVLIFGAAYLALSSALRRAVIGPLHRLAQAADAASLSDAAPPLPQGGAQEIRLLSGAIHRLRLSLAKALTALSEK